MILSPNTSNKQFSFPHKAKLSLAVLLGVLFLGGLNLSTPWAEEPEEEADLIEGYSTTEEDFFYEAGIYKIYDSKHFKPTAIVFDISNILDQSSWQKKPNPAHDKFQIETLPKALEKLLKENQLGIPINIPVEFGTAPRYCFTRNPSVKIYEGPAVRGNGKVFLRISEAEGIFDTRLRLYVDVCLEGVFGEVGMVFPDDWNPLTPPIRYGDCPKYKEHLLRENPEENIGFYTCEIQPYLDALILSFYRAEGIADE